jgi:hypothetical protein
LVVICPAVQISEQKYFASRFARSRLIDSIHPVPERGAYASSRTLGREAVDADSTRDEGCCRGRRSRMVLTPRRRRQVARNELSCSDGGKKARSPGRVRRKPLKPLRRNAGLFSAEPVVTLLVCSIHFAREAMGAAGARRFLRPLLSRDLPQNSDAGALRERNCISRRHCQLKVIRCKCMQSSDQKGY